MVFLGFGWLLLILGSCARASHTPGPSQEGRFGRCFLFENEGLEWWYSPLERGGLGAAFLIEKGGGGDEAASFRVGKMGWAEK